MSPFLRWTDGRKVLECYSRKLAHVPVTERNTFVRTYTYSYVKPYGKRTRVILPTLQAIGAVVVFAQEPDGPAHEGAFAGRGGEALDLASVATPDGAGWMAPTRCGRKPSDIVLLRYEQAFSRTRPYVYGTEGVRNI